MKIKPLLPSSFNILNGFLFLIIFFTIVCKGAYFPYQYISSGIFVFIFCIFNLLRCKEIQIHRSTLTASLILLLAYIISSLLASNRYVAILETYKMLIFCIFLFAVTAGLISMEYFMKSIHYACLAIGIIGILSYFSIISYDFFTILNNGTLRMQSILQYANVTAVFMGIGFFTSCCYLISSTSRSDKLVYAAEAVFFTLCLMLTFSRATLAIFCVILVIWLSYLRTFETILLALIGLPGSFLCSALANRYCLAKQSEMALVITLAFIILASALHYILCRKVHNPGHHKLLLLAGAVIFLTPIAIAGRHAANRILHFSFHEGTLVERVVHILDASRVIAKYPLAGVGPGNWNSIQFSCQSAQYATKYIHNSLVQIAVDSGIIAAAAFVFIVLICLKKQYAFLKNRSENIKKTFLVCQVPIVALILLHSLIDTDASFISILLILSVCMGFILNEAPDGKQLVHLNGKRMLIAFLPVTSVFVIFSAFLLFGQITWNSAKDHYLNDNLTQAINLCKRNKLFRPGDPENYLLLAQCVNEQGTDTVNVEALIRKAQYLDSHDPASAEQLAELYMNSRQYSAAFDAYIRLLDLNPMEGENYQSAIHCLSLMYNNGMITTNELSQDLTLISQKADAANRKRSRLAEFLINQKPISLDVDLVGAGN